jgi:hypothetical protein
MQFEWILLWNRCWRRAKDVLGEEGAHCEDWMLAVSLDEATEETGCQMAKQYLCRVEAATIGGTIASWCAWRLTQRSAQKPL